MSSRTIAVSWIILGAALWLAFSIIGGVQEAWDHSTYWRLGYPLPALISGVGGYLIPLKPWRWPLFLVVGQFFTMFVQNPTSNLLPLGILFLGIVSLPLLIPAYLGALLIRPRTQGAKPE